MHRKKMLAAALAAAVLALPLHGCGKAAPDETVSGAAEAEDAAETAQGTKEADEGAEGTAADGTKVRLKGSGEKGSGGKKKKQGNEETENSAEEEQDAEPVFHARDAAEACAAAGIPSFEPVPVLQESPDPDWYAIEGDTVEATYHCTDGTDLRIRKSRTPGKEAGTAQDARLPEMEPTGMTAQLPGNIVIGYYATDDGQGAGGKWQRDGFYFWAAVYGAENAADIIYYVADMSR